MGQSKTWLRTAGIAAVLLASVTSVLAHERKTSGPYTLTIGWGDEPAFIGFRNTIEVDIVETTGGAVPDLTGAAMTVDVTFGDQHVTLPMRPVFRQPGKLRAFLVPTRAGTYSFHFSGTIKGVVVDASSTCSDTTFACVADVSTIQFPAKDPSPAELADRVSRGLPRAEDAASAAGMARMTAFAAIAVAAIALAIAVRRK
jgi:hypothetical protein